MADYLSITKQIVLKHIDTSQYRVFLFGSRAVGNHKPTSDIDVGIWGDKRLPATVKLELEEELLESIVPFKIDIVDFLYVDKNFINSALEKTVEWR